MPLTKVYAKVTQQSTINSGDGRPRSFAFLWRRYEFADLPMPMVACVMVTVPAKELIKRSIKAGEGGPHMPAILKDFDVSAYGRPGSVKPATPLSLPRSCSRRWKA